MTKYIAYMGKEVEVDKLIVDTNFFLDYNLEGIKMFFHRFSGQIYVPDEVLAELYTERNRKTELKDEKWVKRYEKRKLIEEERLTEGNTKKYHELAQEIMDQTSKSLFYEYEVLGNPIGVAITHELRKKFDEYDLDLKRKTDEMGYSHDEESRRKVAQSFRTTPADVAILSAAIYEAKDNNLDVTVNSRDKDLQEAVEIIRERFGGNFGSKIYFVPEGLTRAGREYSNVGNQYREAM